MQPLVEELSSAVSPAEALEALQDWPDIVLFESVLQRGRLGRYSFLTADPIATFELSSAEFGLQPFAGLQASLSQFSVDAVPDLPPFQGGAAGFLGYESGSCFERIPRPVHDEFELPDAWVGVFDWVLTWDHAAGRAWIISHGLSATDPDARRQRAQKRIDSVLGRLATPPAARAARPQAASVSHLAPQFPLPGRTGVTSDFSPDGYRQAVRRVIDYIHAGDVFQANLSQRLLAAWDRTPCELYRTLRQRNPAPFAGYLAHADWAIVSASPERFVRVQERTVETRPIKGTRQRRDVPEADLFTRDELRESEKDIAENVMIVDLLRNDLSRVCQPGSISVPQLCVVESYETVQHLVSEICGTLADGEDAWSLLAAAFPGGSITGAPKVRAMEIIAELEPTVRGPYCGSLFYAGFNGAFDSSILIRTFVLRHGIVQCSVGGGIVAQSDPLAEYEETMHKAEGMLRVFD
jgi:para-aminobenzoate synthetase component 1